MAATRRGINKYKEWMEYVKRAGWHESTWVRLADIWWEWHDDEGFLLAGPNKRRAPADRQGFEL